ncbi:GntR family transcriptional regulator [Kitasatospora sp. RB6PN24]|uniref:GntR family transcriptional regulator n=1 Tax=Kitasatospora humi TaxID=2893891 RepID=UPI001E58EDED|nr:GntR family transcriptional regulator [Kitasatospora humi]MCC9306886.1 GntR family transcriptional regulator [Kitasatospora humi]
MTENGAKQPKYRRIAEELKAAIDAGQYAPGDRLPGENDLMETYGVARMTARQALGVLQSEGLAEARKGAGVFLRDFRPLRRRGIPRLAESQWGAGKSIWAADVGNRSLEVDHVDVAEASARADIATALDIEPGQAVCVRHRRFLLDGKPILLSTSHFPAALVTGTRITEADTGPGGSYARLAEIGAKPVRFREEIRSRMPNAEEAAALELAAGTPVVLVCRTAYAEDGRAVELNEMVLDAGAYVLEYEFEAC